MKKLSLSKLRAVRSIRAGSTLEEACEPSKLHKESVKALEATFAETPDVVLVYMESVLADNEKLRRIVAALIPTLGASAQ